MGSREDIESGLGGLEREEPEAALRAITALRRRLDELEAAQVERGVRSGSSWSDVAAALGVTKQAVHKKHAHRLRPAPHVPPPGSPFVVSGRARRAVRLARAEARALGATEVAPTHLLLGLGVDAGTAAADALVRAGFSVERGRAVAGARRARPAEGGISVSPATRAIFEDALRDAVARGDAYLGAEHLLRTAVRDPEAEAAAFLRAAGADPGAIHRVLDEAA